MATLVRYSNDAVAKSDAAKGFPWEAPIPANRFWNSFKYCIVRSILINFPDEEELKQLPVDPNSTADEPTKLHFLLHLLRDKLAREERATSPPGSLNTQNYTQWNQLMQGIYVIENELDLPEAEQTVRTLVERRPETSNVVPPHMLSEYLVKHGKYEEAEKTARPVLAWMDARPHLGKSSPQALNSRRIIARALWFQGPSRRTEAISLLTEIHELVEGMGGDKFEVYQEEERQFNEELIAELQRKT
ncbi:uncharacterized protein BHQ10_001193 [Talaromyces amestolkiae]|uniref:Uncharacterized protein n=1 Tax=Talaromyces amestolkiae TaxID=1196081 RepID=A0A364KNU7_TALAM|nr:uncharacterized protein BHQ10_001193 [Talaromyces amestolkiae]RAO65181.1 hypothetical protein BHQ10_001193 [Talaromyces amestolkiae]